MTACLSDLRIDELMAGELDAEDATAATDHLGVCGRCRTRDRELTAARARFRAAIPPLRRRRRVAGVALAAIASAAGLALVLRGAADGTRTKGSARLGVVVVHGGAARQAVPGERVRPGDTLSYLVTTAEPAYVAVVSRDAAGRVATYVHSERVPAGRDHQLSVATVLDDSVGVEQLVAVFCAAPVVAVTLRDAIERDPEGCAVDRVDLEKVR